MHMMGINLNRRSLSVEPLNVTINELIERAEPPEENTRQYLGASSIGSECLHRVQYDWMVDAKHKTRTRDIFARGHFFEELSRHHLIRAGFEFAPANEQDHFETADGTFRGHADGVIIKGPTIPNLLYPCVWEHKALGRKGFQDIERDGLEKVYPHYAVQAWIYQAYLNLPNPALFTVMNADSCERLHFQVPFQIERAQLWSDRAVEIIRATRAGELLPRITPNPNDFRCKRFCGHYIRCWGHVA
jgi:hypothetical protein